MPQNFIWSNMTLRDLIGEESSDERYVSRVEVVDGGSARIHKRLTVPSRFRS